MENETVRSQEELIALMKKQNTLMKSLLGCMGVIAVVVLLTAALLVPRAVSVLSQADGVMRNAQTAVENLTEVSQELADADIAGMIQDTRMLVNESSVGIADTMEKLNRIEFDTLNQAIGDFQKAVAPLAKLFGR